MRKRLFRGCCVFASVLAAAFGLGTSGLAASPGHQVTGEESEGLAVGLDQQISARTAPNATFDPAAYMAAVTAAGSLPTIGAAWNEVGPYNYFTDDPNYADPNFSNSGAGDRYVSGRITALAATSNGGVVVAGGADGGLWRTTNGGANWQPVGDQLATTSIGSLTVDEANGSCVFVAGTGEANTSSDSYAGVGFYRSTDCGQTWAYVGPSELMGAIIWHVRTDPNVPGQEWAATSHGIYVSTDQAASWTLAYKVPTTDFVGNQWTDIAIQPGTSTIVAANGWRNGDPHNGLYISRDGGQSFALDANPNGWVPSDQQGRVTLAYSADGSMLYGIDEDPTQLVDASRGVYTALGGVFSAKAGDPAGPWNRIADASKLANSGSAMKLSTQSMKGYQPGVQAWYNQFLSVDPANPNHLYLGLEEVYETQDGGSQWQTIAPYWNFTLPCFSYTPFEGTCDKNQAHSDQHAAVIANGTLWVGNDGGVYSRGLKNPNVGQWTNDNQTLGTLQFYSATAGQGSGQPLTYYGGLQDNGTAKVVPSTGLAVQPFGGDGGQTYVDPGNPNNVITEYVYLTMARSSNGGHSWTGIQPSDPHPRFIAPFGPDRANPGTLVAGGEMVWRSTKGFATMSSDWVNLYDTGFGHSITGIDSSNGTVYAGWCGPCNPHMSAADSGVGFKRGLATNAGGAWHQLAMTGLPNRYISGVYGDPANGNHAWIVFSGYSRNWIVGPNDPGVGHVFETTDGGNTWTDDSNNLIDSPVNTVLVVNGHLVVGNDIGVFVASDSHGANWQRLGVGLPNVVVDQLSLTPASTILAATHGRGLWTISTSGF